MEQTKIAAIRHWHVVNKIKMSDKYKDFDLQLAEQKPASTRTDLDEPMEIQVYAYSKISFQRLFCSSLGT